MAVALTNDEQMLREDIFTTNLLLFWLKTNFSLTSKRVMGNSPNTFMGIIPLGKNAMTYPLKNIASVISSTKFHFMRLLIGSVLVFLGVSMIGDSFPAAMLIVFIGIFPLLNCYTSTFSITNNAGQAPVVELSILEKSKVQAFVDEINNKIADLS